MTPLFPARRSAERFDSLVEGGRRDDVDRTTSDLLELVSTLRSVPDPQARPEFVADLRERLLIAAEAELTPVPAAARQRDDVARLTIKPVRTRHERRVGIALGAIAIIGATTSMAVASQGAIPGDALYPVKRAIENTEAGFSVGDDAKGETLMGNASERLDEVDELSHRGGGSHEAELVTKTLKDFTQQFTDASNSLIADFEANGNEESIGQIHENAEDSVGMLSGLDGVVPPAAHEALIDAAGAVIAIDSQALNLCPDCGPGLLDVPSTLLAGASNTVNGLTGVLAGGELPGTSPPSADPTGASQPQHQNGGKGHGRPSGMNPPETPIELPTQPSDATTTDLGHLLPGGGTDHGHRRRRRQRWERWQGRQGRQGRPHPGHQHGHPGRDRCGRGRERPAERPHRLRQIADATSRHTFPVSGRRTAAA